MRGPTGWAGAALLAVLTSPALAGADATLKNVDLFLENVSLTPASATGSGSTVQISYDLRNSGNLFSGPFELRFYYGDSASATGLTTLYTRSVPAAAPASSSSLSDTLTLPASALQGVRAIHWFVDVNDSVAEQKENNNQGSVPIMVSGLPDLQITDLQATPAAVAPGQKVKVSFRVKNGGATRADPTHTARVYLSADSTITTGDTYLACQKTITSSLVAGASSASLSCQVTVPSGTTVGSYYLGVIPDYAGQVQESDEADNSTYATALTVGVPDLLVSYLSLSSTSLLGHLSQTTVTFRVSNYESTAAGPFVVRFYYGDTTATTGLTLLASHSVSGLAGNSNTGDLQRTVTMPANVLYGKRYLHCYVDATSAVSESDEDNNRVYTTISITGRPELQVTALTVSPTTVGPGQNMTIGYRLRNDGPSRAQGPFVTRFFHSTDSTITAADTDLQLDLTLASLNAHSNHPATGNGTRAATMPAAAAFGPAFIGAYTDVADDVQELLEINNTRSTAVNVGYAPGSPCTAASQCPSGFCVDGVCCNSACGGGVASDCQACSKAAGAATDGVCAPLPTTHVCRSASGGCDAAETCNGTAVTCPADALKPKGSVCRAAAGGCDQAETCSGSSKTCPSDAIKPAGATCRPAAGACDLAESCDGSSKACPANSFKPATTVCRAAAGPCDLPESCSGSAAACPANSFKPATTVCRAAGGPCDQAETCSGSAAACPADSLKPAGAICRAAVDLCDQAETCSGSSTTCPSDAIAPAGSVCRAAAGQCDLQELCDGASTACPADQLKPDQEPCSGGTCLAGICVPLGNDAGIDAGSDAGAADGGPGDAGAPDSGAADQLVPDSGSDGLLAPDSGMVDGHVVQGDGEVTLEQPGDEGCSCRAGRGPAPAWPWLLLGLLALLRRRR